MTFKVTAPQLSEDYVSPVVFKDKPYMVQNKSKNRVQRRNAKVDRILVRIQVVTTVNDTIPVATTDMLSDINVVCVDCTLVAVYLDIFLFLFFSYSTWCLLPLLLEPLTFKTSL